MRPLGPSPQDPKGQGVPGCEPPGLACREGAGGEEGEHGPPAATPGGEYEGRPPTPDSSWCCC